MTVINLNREFVHPEQIWVDVRCPSCERTMSISMKSPSFRKNCRCNNATFYFTLTAAKGSKVILNVSVQAGFNDPVAIKPEGWEIEPD